MLFCSVMQLPDAQLCLTLRLQFVNKSKALHCPRKKVSEATGYFYPWANVSKLSNLLTTTTTSTRGYLF